MTCGRCFGTLRGTPESGHRAGYDGHKKTRGSKIHAAVDPLGHLLALRVTPANAQERAQVGELADAVQAATGDTVELAWVDQGYTGEDPLEAAEARGIDLVVVRVPGARCEDGLRPAAPAVGGGALLRVGDALPAARQGLRAAAGDRGRLAFRRLCVPHASQTAVSATGKSMTRSSGLSGLIGPWQGDCGDELGNGPFPQEGSRMAYPFRVALTEAQRAALRTLVSSGTAPARCLARARILLKADHGEGGPGWSDRAIAAALDVNASTVLRVRRQFVTDGLAATLERKRPDRVYARTLDGRQEAQLIALACATPPDGHARWSLRLLADELVRLDVVETISYETVRQALQQTPSSRI